MSPQLVAQDPLSSVAGFQAAGIHCGIKQDRPDLALLFCNEPGPAGASAAAVFTQNSFAAAPVHVSRQNVADGDVRAIIVNSGNANACTGRQGLRDALEMVRTTAERLGLEPQQVLVASTGIIGHPLPQDKILAGIPRVAAALADGSGAPLEQAILTTDSGPKTARREVQVEGRTVTLAGCAKGAGMIHPNMATMLAFITTDAAVASAALRDALRHATERSFNQISIDGDGSTNDMATVMASGAAGTNALDPSHADWSVFQDALTGICTDLAQQIAADGEGATRTFEVQITGAADDRQARIAARAVAASNLVKAAIHGNDPNWGRIVAAIGSTDVAVDAEHTSLWISGRDASVQVLDEGTPVPGGDDGAALLLQEPRVTLRIDLRSGDGQGLAWGCDLTPEYVSFNAQYTT